MRAGTQSLVAVVALLVLGAAGCGGGVEVARPAVRGLSHAVGGSATELRLASGEVDSLAVQASVERSVLVDVAENADTMPWWRRSVDTVGQLDRDTDGQVRQVMVDTACDVLQGEPVTVESFYQRLAAQAIPTPRQVELRDAVEDLITAMDEARHSDDPTRRASVVLLCFAADQVE